MSVGMKGYIWNVAVVTGGAWCRNTTHQVLSGWGYYCGRRWPGNRVIPDSTMCYVGRNEGVYLECGSCNRRGMVQEHHTPSFEWVGLLLWEEIALMWFSWSKV